MSPDLDLPTEPERLTLGRFLEDAVSASRDRCAIRFEGRSISYGELEQESRHLARALVGAGVVKGARVAVLMANRPEWVIAAFAIALSGGVLVPVNTFATREERDTILRHSDASVLLLQPRLLKHRFLEDLLADHPSLGSDPPGRMRCEALPQLRRVVALEPAASDGAIESWERFLAHGDDVGDALLDAIGSEIEPADDAMIIYTSGTTAHPKGVLHAHRAPIVQSWRFAKILRLDVDDRVWTTYPFFWTAGICMSLGATLAVGARLVLQETFEPGRALELIESEAASVVHAWPHQQKALAEHPSATTRDLSSVQKLDASSPLAKLAGITVDAYGTRASYGLSETFTIASMLDADAPSALRRSTSGRPLPGMRFRIVNPEPGESGESLPVGKEGEIAVKGVTLMRGYYKIPPEACFDSDGYYRTQDGGFFDAEGYLHWTGRISNLIKTGGANVSPLEIVSILDAYPKLRAALPVGIPHPTLGEALVLCAVASDGVEVSEEEVRAHLKERLAAYKIPRRVLFFAADELTYTSNQKIQVDPLRKAALRRLEDEAAEIDGYRYGARA